MYLSRVFVNVFFNASLSYTDKLDNIFGKTTLTEFIFPYVLEKKSRITFSKIKNISRK